MKETIKISIAISLYLATCILTTYFWTSYKTETQKIYQARFYTPSHDSNCEISYKYNYTKGEFEELSINNFSYDKISSTTYSMILDQIKNDKTN